VVEQLALEARDLSVSRGSGLVLERLNLTIEAARTVAITGPSGSGKSTLLAALAGLVPGESGEVLVGGEKLGKSDRSRAAVRLRRLGIVFQGDEFLPELTLRENVVLPGMLRDRTKKVADLQDAAQDLFVRLGIDGLGDRRPSEVSVGQLQRAASARALLGSSVAVLADEPTSALDQSAASDALHLLLGLARERGVAVCLVTHDPSVAAMCDRQLELSGGRLHEQQAAVSQMKRA
jgi:putative ABC transport system ATP-binding protein